MGYLFIGVLSPLACAAFFYFFAIIPTRLYSSISSIYKRVKEANMVEGICYFILYFICHASSLLLILLLLPPRHFFFSRAPRSRHVSSSYRYIYIPSTRALSCRRWQRPCHFRNWKLDYRLDSSAAVCVWTPALGFFDDSCARMGCVRDIKYINLLYILLDLRTCEFTRVCGWLL